MQKFLILIMFSLFNLSTSVLSKDVRTPQNLLILY